MGDGLSKGNADRELVWPRSIKGLATEDRPC